jgi:hypothetical protein
MDDGGASQTTFHNTIHNFDFRAFEWIFRPEEVGAKILRRQTIAKSKRATYTQTNNLSMKCTRKKISFQK